MPLLLLEAALNLFHYGTDTRVFLKDKYLPGQYYENSFFQDKYFSKIVHPTFGEFIFQEERGNSFFGGTSWMMCSSCIQATTT